MTDREARRHVACLRQMLESERTTLAVYDNANGENNRKIAGIYRDRVAALGWALLRIEPTTEGPRQALGEIMRAGE